jgi:nicotinamidase-related amidase
MLRREKAVLVVVDVQGKLATLMHDREEFFSGVEKAIKGCQALGIPVIWNEQLPDKLGPTVESVSRAFKDNSPLAKKTFSCCGNPAFVQRLKETGRRQIILVGMESHVCVYKTALDLLSDGYEVRVAADAVSSRTLINKNTGLDAMREAGAKITTVEMALFEMLDVAEGDVFKEIISIVK